MEPVWLCFLDSGLELCPYSQKNFLPPVWLCGVLSAMEVSTAPCVQCQQLMFPVLLADCSAFQLCAAGSDTHGPHPSIWRIPQSNSPSLDLWTAVHFLQVRSLSFSEQSRPSFLGFLDSTCAARCCVVFFFSAALSPHKSPSCSLCSYTLMNQILSPCGLALLPDRDFLLAGQHRVCEVILVLLCFRMNNWR